MQDQTEGQPLIKPSSTDHPLYSQIVARNFEVTNGPSSNAV